MRVPANSSGASISTFMMEAPRRQGRRSHMHLRKARRPAILNDISFESTS